MKFWREAVIALMALALGYMWLESHDAKIRSGVYEEARKQIQQKEQEQLQQIEDLKKQVRDPQVIVKEVPKYLPFNVVSTGPSMKPSGEPVPPEITIQGQELPKFWDYVQDCRACSVKLEARDAEVKNLEQELKAERKKKGFWGKLKWGVVGAGIGAAVGYAASH